MQKDSGPDTTRVPAFRVILDDDIASPALAILVLGVVLLAILAPFWLAEGSAYRLFGYLVVFLLMVLLPVVVMFHRVRGASSLLENGMNVRAPVVKREFMPGSMYTVATLFVTLSYRVLDTTYEARVSETGPTSLGPLKEGDEVTLVVDPNNPSRYALRIGRMQKQGRSKVSRPQQTGEQVKALIVRFEHVGSRKSGHHATDLAFNFRGQDFRVTRKIPIRWFPKSPFKVGDEVVLVVNPDSPQSFYFRDWFRFS